MEKKSRSPQLHWGECSDQWGHRQQGQEATACRGLLRVISAPERETLDSALAAPRTDSVATFVPVFGLS